MDGLRRHASPWEAGGATVGPVREPDLSVPTPCDNNLDCHTAPVPALRTEITEIVTGLAMCGMAEVGLGLQHRPPQLLNVDDATWARVVGAWDRREYGQEFHAAWANGFAFLKARDGLRGKVPLRVEWKGPHKAPGDERVPADLRVDHVYLVSCKYLSSILHNASPSSLFDHRLAPTDTRIANWYAEVAPAEYQALYEAVRNDALPHVPADLSRDERRALSETLKPGWPDGAQALYEELAAVVARESATRWHAPAGQGPGPGGDGLAPAAPAGGAVLRPRHDRGGDAAGAGRHPVGLAPALRAPGLRRASPSPAASLGSAGA